MESREIHCQKCNKDTLHTFRYHITKTKHYSVVSVGSGKKQLTLVCHVCLIETLVEKKVAKKVAKELMVEYDKEIAVGEANELMDKQKYSKAENKLRRVLNKDPEFPQALYSISKCSIIQSKYAEAEFYIKTLETKFPDEPEIKELRDLLPPKLNSSKSKTAVISSDDDVSNSKDYELCGDPRCTLNRKGQSHSIHDSNRGLQKTVQKTCRHCYHEEKEHDNDLPGQDERACIGCLDDGFTKFCTNFSEIPNNNKQSPSDDSKNDELKKIWVSNPGKFTSNERTETELPKNVSQDKPQIDSLDKKTTKSQVSLNDEPLKILKIRLAKGEITIDEFKELKDIL
jgi:tetratricopeptide (TPR) repeat protein